jgi:DNA-binding transcriptional ArsR family regulator
MSLRSTLTPILVLAHETRWRIAELLLEKSLRVADLAEILQLGRTNVSNHVQLMHRAGVLEAQRKGRLTHYRLADRFATLLPVLRTHAGISERSDPMLSADAWHSQQHRGQ